MGFLRRVIPAQDTAEKLERFLLQVVTARPIDKPELVQLLRERGYSQLHILQAIQKFKANGKIVEEEPPPAGGPA